MSELTADRLTLDVTSDMLCDRYGDLGKTAARNLRDWVDGKVFFAFAEIVERHFLQQHLDLLFDAFWQVLPFGTGGRRGRVGYGPNRMNMTTVGTTVQGHCQYLRSAFPGRDDLVVVVANDVRVFNDVVGVYRFLGEDHPLLGASSRSFGRLACEIYAANGIVAYFAAPREADAVLTTPELSYLIGELGAVGGINLSASHNPPDDNGIKVYDSFGSQPVAPHDQELADVMNEVEEVRRVPLEKAIEEGLVREIPHQPHESYVETYVRLYDNVHEPDADTLIVYTPLCGCGGTTVGEVLGRLGFPVLIPPGQEVDGSFAMIPFRVPNPEVSQATDPARKFADARGAGVVLSSDPDADRVGVDVKLRDGTWYHFDGNQIATVLCYFLMLDPAGPKRRGLVIETLVTAKTLGKIVEEAGDSWIIDDLLVGFKYVADVLKSLQTEGRYRDISCSPEDLVLAAEESHGVLMVPGIRDKDATPACMFLAALCQRLAREGKTLRDYYIHILQELGGYDCVNRSIMLSGADGMLKKNQIMKSLRESLPETFGGHDVKSVNDYWDEERHGRFVSETDRLPRNVLQMFTESFIITVRPSGTEPKLKLYCQLLPDGQGTDLRGEDLLRDVRERVDAVARKVYNELLGRIGLSLGEVGLLLPDIIDLGRKQDFENTTVPKLRDKLAAGRFESLDGLLDWLRKESSELIPGTEALPAIRAPLRHLVKEWNDDFARLPFHPELLEWLGIES